MGEQSTVDTELFYSGVEEVKEVVEEPKNSTLFSNHILCQVYKMVMFCCQHPKLDQNP